MESPLKVSFDLEIVSRTKNPVKTDITLILQYLKLVFVLAKVNNVQITDHFGRTYSYCNGKFTVKDNKTEPVAVINQPYKPIKWTGHAHLQIDQFEKLIIALSQSSAMRNDQLNFFWRFDKQLCSNFGQLLSGKPTKENNEKFPSQLNQFSFGTIINGNYFVNHKKISYLNYNLEAELSVHRKRLVVTFSGCYLPKNEKIMLIYNFDSIKSLMIQNVDPLGFLLYIGLNHPPKMFLIKTVSKQKPETTRIKSCTLIPKELLGKSNVCRLALIADKPSDYIEALSLWYRNHQFDLSFGFLHGDKTVSRLEPSKLQSDFPFSIQYALECVKSLNSNFEDDLEINHNGEDVINEIIKNRIKCGKSDQVCQALYRLFYDYAANQVYDAFEHFKYLLSLTEKEWKMSKNLYNDNDWIKYVRHALLTPTKTVFLPPSPVRTSWFLSEADPDFVIKVNYRDEDGQSLGNASNNLPESWEKKGDEYYCVPSSTLKDNLVNNGGLIVGGRIYEYYGASSSQLKDGGMVLYAKDSLDRTASLIRDSYGIVKENSVPKYIARIGLSLSQIMSYVDLPEYTNIYLASDIYGGSHPETKKPYNFTDGCGFISIEVSRFIYNDLVRRNVIQPEKDENYFPSAFQIRYFGSKGMLVVDRNLIGMSIVIREESMQKLFTKKGQLGIVKISAPRRAFLNRPFINVLDQNGLSKGFLMDLGIITLSKIYASLYDNALTPMLLKTYTYMDRLINIDDFAQSGFEFISDSFFVPILKTTFEKAVYNLRNKARIPLPWSKARTMFGVCDPTAICTKSLATFDYQGNCKAVHFDSQTRGHGTGLLKSGQVFLWPSDLPRPITGEVIVTKFPASSPGDVRKLVAVDYSALHDIKDCIVFPIDGDRPHPDEMAGSDLDGDEYFVCWDENFLKIEIKPPMVYPENPKNPNFETITTESMINHHIECLKANVGQISNAQLTFSDIKDIDSDESKNLSVKYSRNLDAPKHGMNDEYLFKPNDRCLESPDFMEKWGFTPTIPSIRANGQLYRLFKFLELYLPNQNNGMESNSANYNIEERLIHPNWNLYENLAFKTTNSYEKIIDTLLSRFGFKSEAELFTGLFDDQSSSSCGKNYTVDRDDSMVAIINSLLINKMDKIFDIELAGSTENDKMAAASAFYIISKRKAESLGSKCLGLPFIGKYGQNLAKLLQLNHSKDTDLNNIDKKEIIKYELMDIQELSMEEIMKNVEKDLEIIKDFIESLYKSSSKKRQKHINRTIESNSVENYSLCQRSGKHVVPDLIDRLKRKSDEVDNFNDSSLTFINQTFEHISLALICLRNHRTKKTTEKSQTFCIRSNEGKTEMKLVEVLKKLLYDSNITILNQQNCTHIMIYGSPEAIWFASILIGIYNGINSIYLKKP